MKKNWIVLTTGFAMFSMFFGSGNLVFPIAVGQSGSGYALAGSLGILLTGVLMPFLGMFGMMLYKGDTRDFFGAFGKSAVFWFSLIALSLMGPFGVLARCITVAQGSFRLIMPELSLVAFSAVMCASIFVLTVRKNKIVPLLGGILTPVLLGSLFLLVLCGVYAPSEAVLSSNGGLAAFSSGVQGGYQMMDLIAAFFFSNFVIDHLQKTKTEESGCSLSIFLKSALLGAGLLSLVYVGLVMLGNNFASLLQGVPPEEMLGTIAVNTLGPWGAPIVCVAVILACLTTAVVLASLYADFLRVEVAQNKLGHSWALLITLAIAFVVSTLEFAGIAKFLGPILETLYPAVIVLTILNIADKLWGWRLGRWPVVATLVTKLLLPL